MDQIYFEGTYEESEKIIKDIFPDIPSENKSGLLVPPEVGLNNPNSSSLLEQKKKEEYDKSIELILGAPKEPFDGQKIFDIMYSLGLKWGDMDIFHWENNSNCGDDYYFDVWTDSEPGYFIPQDIKEHNLKFRNLIFGFKIPRTCKPTQVLENMIKAVEYSNEKLNGIILYNGSPIFDDYEEIKKIVSDIEQGMINDGLEPGSDAACHIY